MSYAFCYLSVKFLNFDPKKEESFLLGLATSKWAQYVIMIEGPPPIKLGRFLLHFPKVVIVK